jgi:hypothetical protein
MYPTKSSPQINRITKYPNKETRHTVIPLIHEKKSTFLSKTTDLKKTVALL